MIRALVVTAIALLLAVGCEGEQGPVGPQGPLRLRWALLVPLAVLAGLVSFILRYFP